MGDQPDAGCQRQNEYMGVYSDGVIRLSAEVDWTDGTPVCVRVAEPLPGKAVDGKELGKVIIAGFGPGGAVDRRHLRTARHRIRDRGNQRGHHRGPAPRSVAR